MARSKDYAYTTFSESIGLQVEIDGQRYDVVQFSGSWALNQVPEAMCMLALGRNTQKGGQLATIHKSAKSLRSMKKAKVFFHPKGDYSPDGTKWPDGEKEIFSGYYAGYGYQKANGKVNFVVYLTHWLVDLGFSSSLSSISHPSNPAALTSRAIVEPIGPGAGGGGQGIFISELIPHAAVEGLIAGDMWAAIKTVLCGMSQFEGFDPICGAGGIGRDQLKHNERATKALKRIEGPGGDCQFAYKYGKALPLELNLVQASAGIARAIGHVLTSEMWNHTLWDALIGYYCPLFGMDLAPAIDRAMVIASLPAFRTGKYWRTIRPNEYDWADQNAMLPKPLRAVVVHGSIAMETRPNFSEASQVGSCMSGVFASKAVEDGDGAIIYQRVPDWMAEISLADSGTNDATGNVGEGTIKTATTPDGGNKPKGKTPKELFDPAQQLLDKYAQTVFIQNALRGRSGSISGKLRFDIAPGSHLHMEGSPEKFIGGEDELAGDQFAQAVRVTAEINAESRRAGTAIVLAALRNDAENQADRTSLDKHPFYGSGVILGAPLLPDYDLK